MKKGLLAVVAAFALALCLGLVGCGGADPEKDFIGTWELESGAGEKLSIPAKDVSMLRDVGIVCTLTLDAEGKAVLDMFGETLEGEWKAKGLHEGKVSFDGDAVPAIIDEAGKLTLEQDGLVLTFVPHAADDSQRGTESAEA